MIAFDVDAIAAVLRRFRAERLTVNPGTLTDRADEPTVLPSAANAGANAPTRRKNRPSFSLTATTKRATLVTHHRRARCLVKLRSGTQTGT